MYVSKKFLKEVGLNFLEGMFRGTVAIAGGLMCYCGVQVISNALNFDNGKEKSNEPK